jgi:membrane protein DedA with SNARE-associated domain/rhodanese-related sulfurtransferase
VNSLFPNISHHGYLLLFSAVFAEAIGLPLPAALALLIAGGSAANGSMHFGAVLLTSCCALLLGDALLFTLGRFTGWWLLAVLCRVSLHPDSCIWRSAQSFHRYGRTLLLFAKFAPGINTLAAPLAGSMNMPFTRFLLLDVVGALLYASVWSGGGFLFRDFLAPVTRSYHAGSRLFVSLASFAIAGYFLYRIWLLLKAGALSYVPRVSPSEVARRVYSDIHEDMALYDVRSHGYYSSKASRIKGSSRIDPNLLSGQIENLPKDKELILYCTCQREATSLNVARILHQHGFRASVIKGGLRAWKKAGFPLEPVPAEDIVLLPTF